MQRLLFVFLTSSAPLVIYWSGELCLSQTTIPETSAGPGACQRSQLASLHGKCVQAAHVRRLWAKLRFRTMTEIEVLVRAVSKGKEKVADKPVAERGFKQPDVDRPSSRKYEYKTVISVCATRNDRRLRFPKASVQSPATCPSTPSCLCLASFCPKSS